MAGQYVSGSNHYYYGDVLFRYHHPFEKRTVERNKAFGQQADAAATVTERKAVTKETGVTGLSVFYRLHNLCGFDPIKDLVIDAIHALTLNWIRSKIEKHLLADLGYNQDCQVLDRSTCSGGVLDRNDLAKAFYLLRRIHQLVFSKELRIDGWTQHHIKVLHNLLWKHAIFLESLYGITSCTENVEYSLHMAEDIERHSTLDNYWCYVNN